MRVRVPAPRTRITAQHPTEASRPGTPHLGHRFQEGNASGDVEAETGRIGGGRGAQPARGAHGTPRSGEAGPHGATGRLKRSLRDCGAAISPV